MKKELRNWILRKIVAAGISTFIIYLGYNSLLQEDCSDIYIYEGLVVILMGIIMLAISIEMPYLQEKKIRSSAAWIKFNSMREKAQQRWSRIIESLTFWRIRKICCYIVSWILIISGSILAGEHYLDISPKLTSIGIVMVTFGAYLWIKYYYEKHSEWKAWTRRR